MKLNLASVALALTLPTIAFSQERGSKVMEGYPNTYSSGASYAYPFTQKAKRFNDWAISAGVGVPLVQSADLTSIKNYNGTNLYGYSAYVSIDKAITHAFGLNLQYDRGETRQGWFDYSKDYVPGTRGGAKTQYDAVSLLADINFSNLLRRVDNQSNFRWALHGYAGFGLLTYKAYLKDAQGGRLMTEQKFKDLNFFGQAGAGLKYKISRRVDLEARVMYVVTGDDEFDGGGDQYSAINLIEEQNSDNFFNATLGVTLKLGKHQSHLFWHDPLQELYYKIDNLAANSTPDVEVCKNGDKDNDGVCDDWDRQLDTPAGARVDGAGVALDTDLDGVIDRDDKCVTVPGAIDNEGCPVSPTLINRKSGKTVKEITKEFEGIEFALNKDIIRPQSFDKLNNAAEILKTMSPDNRFLVVGCTDVRASENYNQVLSQKRAAAVVKYLVEKGVPASMLVPEGRGEKDLKYPECDPAEKCPEWKNEANRRVYFEVK